MSGVHLISASPPLAVRARAVRPAALTIGAAGRRHLAALAGVVGGATAFVVVFALLGSTRHGRYLSHAFDMGFVLQMFWKFRVGGEAFSTVLGLDVWGDHSRLLLWPLRAVVPTSATALIVLQSAALASGAVPLYFMVRDRTSIGPGLFVAGLYLAHPALQWAALADVHPEVVATPVLLWAMWGAERKAWRAYWVFTLAALAAREDVALAVVLVGVVLVLEGERRRGVATIALSVAWFAVALAVLEINNPYSLGHFHERYGWLGSNPWTAAAHLFDFLTIAHADPVTPNAAALVGAYYLPVCLAVLAGPRRIWLPLPALGAYVLSAQAQQASVYFHYGYLVLPLMFFAAVDGAGRASSLPKPNRRALWVATASVATGSALLLSPFTDRAPGLPSAFPKPAAIQTQLSSTHPAAYRAEVAEALDAVPPNASVSAPGNLVPHLAQRDEVYMLPNPFLPAWYGPYLHSATPIASRPTIHGRLPAFVVTDVTSAGPERARLRAELLELLPRRYEPVFTGRFVTVWRLRDHWKVARDSST